MSEAITDAEMEHLKKLARLELDDASTQHAKQDINKVLAYFEALSQLDTNGLPEMPRPVELKNVLRPDQVSPGFSQAQALELGLSTLDGFFKIPRTVE